jgi:hypothetical protein
MYKRFHALFLQEQSQFVAPPTPNNVILKAIEIAIRGEMRETQVTAPRKTFPI